MTTTTFDSLGYAKKLEEAGFTRLQAETQATALREQLDAHSAAMRKLLEDYDESSRKDLATKGDVQDVRLEIAKVRADMEKMKYDLLKWQIAGWAVLAAIMAKGFGWIGF